MHYALNIAQTSMAEYLGSMATEKDIMAPSTDEIYRNISARPLPPQLKRTSATHSSTSFPPHYFIPQSAIMAGLCQGLLM